MKVADSGNKDGFVVLGPIFRFAFVVVVDASPCVGFGFQGDGY